MMASVSSMLVLGRPYEGQGTPPPSAASSASIDQHPLLSHHLKHEVHHQHQRGLYQPYNHLASMASMASMHDAEISYNMAAAAAAAAAFAESRSSSAVSSAESLGTSVGGVGGVGDHLTLKSEMSAENIDLLSSNHDSVHNVSGLLITST